MRFLKDNKGFTLFEIAIVLIILGFIFVPIFAITAQKQLDDQSVEEDNGRKQAVAAINFYLKQNGGYPCPAPMALAPDTIGFGVGSVCGAVGGVGMGALPVTTLGLPFHAAVNQHGWKYIYAVTSDLQFGVGPGFNGVGAIQVNGLSGPASAVTGVHFVVVDPGKDGKGSFSLDGTVSSVACAGALDTENCNGNDGVFLDAGIADVADPSSAAYYDDVIQYSHVNEKTDFWVMKNSDTNGDIEISNRSLGNVGFGTTAPTQRVDVAGNVVLETTPGGQGGQIEVEGDIIVTDTLTADQITAGGGIGAARYCSSGWAYNSGGSVECCDQRVYQVWSAGGFNEECGNQCFNGQFLGANGRCCGSRSDFDDMWNCP